MKNVSVSECGIDLYHLDEVKPEIKVFVWSLEFCVYVFRVQCIGVEFYAKYHF